MNSADLFRTEFQESIDVAFIETRLATSRGRVLAPLEPFGLRTPIQEAAEGVVLKLDPYAEWLPSDTLLYFYWDSFGPISFDATIALVDLGVTGTLAYYITEYAPPYAFALIQPGGDTDIWPAFVVNLFRDNGESYGIELFGGGAKHVEHGGAVGGGGDHDPEFLQPHHAHREFAEGGFQRAVVVERGEVPVALRVEEFPRGFASHADAADVTAVKNRGTGSRGVDFGLGIGKMRNDFSIARGGECGAGGDVKFVDRRLVHGDS